jgi:putative addiction module killer protein
MVVDVREYIDTAGRSPFRKWLDALNVQAAAKVATALERIAAGNLSNVKTVGGGVLEFKIDFGPGYRIYFGRDGDRLVILLAGRHEEAPAGRHPPCKGQLGRLPAQEESGENTMPLTKDFRETIRARAQREPRFRKALLREAIELMLSGDEKMGRAILRNYINATVGFRQLEDATSIPATSLMRMFGPNGNPSAKNLFGVLAHLQAQEGVNFEIRPRRS